MNITIINIIVIKNIYNNFCVFNYNNYNNNKLAIDLLIKR